MFYGINQKHSDEIWKFNKRRKIYLLRKQIKHIHKHILKRKKQQYNKINEMQ